jgi:sulfur carrier protein ThiS
MIQQIEDYKSAAESRGCSLIGSLLSFKCPETLSVPFTLLRDGLANHPDIPADWVPDVRNQLSLYLDCVTSLNRSSASKFTIDEAECGFNEETHGGYNVHRMLKQKDSQIPAIHKVFHFEKKIVEVEVNGKVVKQVEDVEADEGIDIALFRVEGTSSTDKDGKSIFRIIVNSDEPYPPRYIPFVRQLEQDFADVQNLIYGSKQVRHLINTIFNDHLHVLKVNSWGFALPENLVQVKALETILNNLDKKICFLNIPITDADDAVSKSAFDSVSVGISESLDSEIDKLLLDIEGLVDNESKTRDSTWADRALEIKNLEKRIEKYRSIALITSDFAQEQLKECWERLDAGQNASLSPLVPTT